MQHVQQRREVAVARRREEGLDHLVVPAPGRRSRRPDPPPPDAGPGAAGQLLGRRGGPAEDLADLGEGHGEDVVQHERRPLGRSEGVKDHQQRQPRRLAHQRLRLGIGAGRGRGRRRAEGDDRVGHMDVQVERLLAPGPPRAQLVQADAGHHGGEPAVEVGHLAGVGAGQTHATPPAPRRRRRPGSRASGRPRRAAGRVASGSAGSASPSPSPCSAPPSVSAST